MEDNQTQPGQDSRQAGNSAENLKESARGTFENVKIFLSELLDIRHDTDKQETVESVKKEISFKGHNAWILIFSVFVASIGLNVSSTAVVIGAMLISPLMGPIVGVGLGVAINDIDTLRRSLINLGIMIGLSILTAYLYFLLSPLTKLTPELEARTYPTILDVLVAIFGGLALIVAKTKKGTMPSVIYGVAIATALMPPLCTAGYGLAVWNLEYFGGAFYLFTINSIFIALSAFVVAKLLGFPLVKYANSQRRKRIAQIATGIAIVVMVPSALLFWNLLQKEIFESNADTFVTESIIYDEAYVYRHTANYDEKTIELLMGGEPVPEGVINTWKTKLMSSKGLSDVTLLVKQAKGDGEVSVENYTNLVEELQARNRELRLLRDQLNKQSAGNIAFEEVIREMKLNYEELEGVSYSNNLVAKYAVIDSLTNRIVVDTIPEFKVRWQEEVSMGKRLVNMRKLEGWLKFKLNKDTLVIREDR